MLKGNLKLLACMHMVIVPLLLLTLLLVYMSHAVAICLTYHSALVMQGEATEGGETLTDAGGIAHMFDPYLLYTSHISSTVIGQAYYKCFEQVPDIVP
jgi:hypothetical protein